jgi:hypothetical protein
VQLYVNEHSQICKMQKCSASLLRIYYPVYFTVASIPLLRIMVTKLDRIINLLKPDTNDGTEEGIQ